MKNLEQTLDSREVAEMIGKTHANLLKDIRRYCTQLGEVKIDLSDFFKESTYRTEQGKDLPCYNVTKKGCEFIANKLTGTKGTEFTARYINRFHEMEDVIAAGQTKSQTEYLAKALLEAKHMLDEKDEHIKVLEQRVKTEGAYDYKKYIMMYVNQIHNQRRLCKIYTIAKNMHKFEQEKEYKC